ncbi:MAG: N,N-dimethyltransferase [Gemmatimonadetes bacterium]|nr:N,N-dimethyltransferase [Gemmatimonadota bacterium]
MIYRTHAELYDRIYHWKDYEGESRKLRALLTHEGIEEGSAVLEAACGTGLFLEQLQDRYEMSGFDIHEPMLELARRRVPSVPLFAADMRRFALDSPVDALLCLFSSIGYLRSDKELSEAAACFARALRPGGLLVVEPWILREHYEPGRPSMHTYADENLKLCRAVVAEIDGDRAVMEMNWLVAARDQPIRHLAERHEMRFTPIESMLAILEETGFHARFEEEGLMEGRGLYIARRAATRVTP